MLKNNVEYQGHPKLDVPMLHVGEKGLDLSNIVCEYKVNPLTNDKLLQKSKTLMPTDSC